MRSTSRAAVAALVGIMAVGGSGCASHTAPEGFLTDAKDVGRDPYGAWIDLTCNPRTLETESVRGELLAATADSLWVLGTEGAIAVATKSVLDGQLVRYDSRPGDVALATVIGTVTTASHGAFLVFTAPMWIIGGSLSAGSQSRVPIRELPVYNWERLAADARFPQGLPAGLDPSSVRPKQDSEVDSGAEPGAP